MALQIGSPWQNGAPAFMQQGQVDWVAFGNTIWHASAAVLQRFAASNIQPVTFGAGLALASQFRMSVGGRERMDHTIRSLRGVPGLDKLLWFGFGQQSFVKMMGETQLGLNCVALCSCLAEVHSEERAARVLKELWELKGFPEEYEPAHSQFLALVKACSGAVARGGFGEELDAMIGYGEMLEFAGEGATASDATDLAKALDGLFQMTRGKVETVTFVGENECAFLAAIGRWLFDLTVYIEDSNGRLIYRSHESVTHGNTQILVQYSAQDRPGTLQQGTTFILPIGTALVSNDSMQFDRRWILKVSWDRCLQRAYGRKFKELLRLSHIFGSYLGVCARIYTALARGEPNVGEFSRAKFINFPDYAHGAGFIHGTTTIFSELERAAGLTDSMERSLHGTVDDAVKELEQNFQSLKKSCSCDVCSDRQLGDSPTSSEDSDRFSSDCLVALALTIRHLIMILACTDRDPHLLVAVHGLKTFYAFHQVSYRMWMGGSAPEVTLPALVTGLKINTAADVNLSKDKFSLPSEVPKNPIDEIRPLFDGSSVGQYQYEHTRFSATATAADGICCYRQCLRSCTISAQVMRTIYVIPGHIEKFYTPYDYVSDGLNERWEMSWSSEDRVTLGSIDSEEPRYKPIHLGKFNIKALAFDSPAHRQLRFYYKIIEPEGAIQKVYPGQFTEYILHCTGLLACSRGRKCRKQLCAPANVIRKGWDVGADHDGLVYESGLALCWWFYNDDLARCYVFNRYITKKSGVPSNIFLRRDECLPCSSQSCVREAGRILQQGKLRLEREIVHLI